MILPWFPHHSAHFLFSFCLADASAALRYCFARNWGGLPGTDGGRGQRLWDLEVRSLALAFSRCALIRCGSTSRKRLRMRALAPQRSALDQGIALGLAQEEKSKSYNPLKARLMAVLAADARKALVMLLIVG